MLGVVDLVLLSISLLVTIAIGVYHSIQGRKATPAEYMLGGRAMSPLPLSMSMMMGTISSVTIMGNVGEIYAYGTQFWIMDIGLALGMVIVAQAFIPIFFPLKMVSLYQYIQQRFLSPALRIATVVITILAAYLFLGFLLYPPSLFLVKFTGLGQVSNIIIMGFTCGLYSAFGGVKAVVHTDVVQSVVMLVGVLAIVIQCIVGVGGLTAAWEIAGRHGRIEFFNMSINPYQRHSFWLTLTYGLFFSLSTYGVTQSQTQRTFSTGSVKQAQRVIYYAIFWMLLLRFLINLAGVVIFSFYAECDPLTAGGKFLPNIFIVIIYVLQDLTKIPGLAGLFVASIYAAVLSSISTQVNSMTALVWEDFLKDRPVFKDWSEVKITWLQKLIVFLTGIVGILACMVLVFIDSPDFITLLLKLTGAISGPMVGLFLTGLYLPWVKGRSAAVGFTVSIILSFWIVCGQLWTQPKPPYLPMSHAGCPMPPAASNATEDALLNNTTEAVTEMIITTVAAALDNITATTAGTLELISEAANEDSGSSMNALYGLSYCLNYCWGTITTMLVAGLVTLLAGWNTPDTLDQKLVSPTAWKAFTRLPLPTYEPPLQRLLGSLSSNRHDTYDTQSGGQLTPPTAGGESGGCEDKFLPRDQEMVLMK